jgi:ACS family D-galactonate transporter-like MFS transporter
MVSKADYGTELVRPTGLRNNFRWVVIGMCSLSFFINYLDRTILGVALPFIREDLHIPDSLSGLLLGVFFVGYALTQMPVGRLFDRWAVRPLFVGGAVLWGTVTMLISLATNSGHLLITRFLLGLGESVNYPGAVKVTSKWFPVNERVFATSIWDNGSRVGSALSLPIVTGLIALFGWRWTFVVAGALAILWAVGFWLLYRDPGKGRGSAEELAYIRAGGAHIDKSDSKPSIPWRQLFRYRTVWAMILGFFCLNYVIYFFITWFPSYLVDARGFDILQLGLFGMIPGLTAVLGSFAGGWTSDYLLRKGWSVGRARKVCLVGGMLVSSVIMGAVFVESAAAALALLSISYGAVAFAGCNVASLPADVAPDSSQVSSLAGIQNAFANVAGFIGPVLTGILLAVSGGSYVVPLVIAGFVAIAGALIYAFMIGKIEPLTARPGKNEPIDATPAV